MSATAPAGMPADRATTADRYPVRLLAVTLVLTAATFAWLGRIIFDSSRDAEIAQQQFVRMEKLRGVILHFGEALGGAVRLAVTTGDAKWEERYRRFEPPLAAAIEEVKKFAAESSSARAAARTDEANRILVEMENRALALVRSGRLDEARAVVFSPEFEREEKIYAAGSTSFMAEIRRDMDERQRRQQRVNLLSMGGAAVILAISFAAWWSVLRGLQRWRAVLEKAVGERRQAEQALRRAQEELEVRIEQRTAELGDVNRALAAENVERWRAEDTLRETEVRLAHAMSLAQLFAWEYDVASGLFTFSDRYYVLHGTTAEREGGHQMSAPDFVRRFVHPDDAHLIAEETGKAVATTDPNYRAQLECRIFRRDGELRYVLTSIAVTTDAAGQTIELHGANQDITERKRSEAALQESETRFRVIFNESPVGIALVDFEGRPFLTNAACQKMLGRTAEALCGMVFTEFTYPEDRDKDMDFYRQLIAGERDSYQIDKRYIRKDGQLVWTSLSVTLIRDSAGQPQFALALVEDITEHKRLEAQVAETHQKLLETSRQAGMAEIATSVLHNVGNVLNSVNVSATLVADQVRRSEAGKIVKVAAMFEQHQTDLAAFLTNDPRGRIVPGYLAALAESVATEQSALVAELEHLRKNVEHIKGVVAQQQSHARTVQAIETVSVTEMVEDALRVTAEALARHGVETIRDYRSSLDVRTDRHKVLQILINLVRNAKFACVESGRTDRHINVRTTSAGLGVQIAVHDNGVGIAAENLTRIFNHGFTTRRDGHGFGLHSGALAAKQLGGSLKVQSDGPGRGATFTLELPLTPPTHTRHSRP